MSQAPLFVLLPDAGADIGGGHVMRSLTLARALEARGATCVFAASHAARTVLEAFGAPAGGMSDAGDASDLDGLAANAAEIAASNGADGLILDHYRLSPAQQAKARGGRMLAVIDDLAAREHDCDLLIDPGLGNGAQGRALDGATILLGPDYALVRPEFAARRTESLTRRADGGPVRRVLISLGLTDFDGITGKVLSALVQARGEVEFDVVVGGQAPSVRALIDLAWSDKRLKLHVDAKDMARLMAEADLAIGAGGSSLWERASLGLPSITLILADNQRPSAEGAAAAGGALVVDATLAGWETRLVAAWRELVDSPERRAAISTASAALCDGQGADRAAAALISVAQARR